MREKRSRETRYSVSSVTSRFLYDDVSWPIAEKPGGTMITWPASAWRLPRSAGYQVSIQAGRTGLSSTSLRAIGPRPRRCRDRRSGCRPARRSCAVGRRTSPSSNLSGMSRSGTRFMKPSRMSAPSSGQRVAERVVICAAPRRVHDAGRAEPRTILVESESRLRHRRSRACQRASAVTRHVRCRPTPPKDRAAHPEVAALGLLTS